MPGIKGLSPNAVIAALAVAVGLPIDLDLSLESSANGGAQKIDQMLPADLLLHVPTPP